MDDSKIIELYWQRSEDAIKETDTKYGRYCRSITYNILEDHFDSEECVNEAYLHAWNTIPPKRPDRFYAFLGKQTRNISLDVYRGYAAKKRGGRRMSLALDELEPYIPASNDTESIVDDIVLTDALNSFLSSLTADARNIFLKRYWYLCSIKEIADEMSSSESRIKMSLLRSRSELKLFLEKEGLYL